MARELLDEDALRTELSQVGWTRVGEHIEKTVTRPDFAQAMAFVNRVAEVAEEKNHHPDIGISWNRVTLRLSTHDAGGLTALDFDLARAVDRLDMG
jgi:4a-hydroxytetrahydrobiopterin dehydratase